MVQLLHSIKAHNDKVWSVSVHPTLPIIATASTDKSTKLYKLSARQKFPLVAKLEDTHKRSIRSVAFKPPLGGADTPKLDFLDLPALAAGSLIPQLVYGVLMNPTLNMTLKKLLLIKRKFLLVLIMNGI